MSQSKKIIGKIITLPIIFFFLQSGLFGQMPCPSSIYFPLKENAKYYYRGFFDSKEDSSMIKIRKKNIKGGCEAYYFDEINKSSSIIGHNMFGLGVYLKQDDKIYTIEAFWKADTSKIHCMQKQLLLPDSIKIPGEVKFLGDQSNPIYSLSIADIEDVDVPAGKFNNCAKIKINSKWASGREYVEYVWLAKNIGLIKWRKSTGRIEVLVDYYLPKN